MVRSPDIWKLVLWWSLAGILFAIVAWAGYWFWINGIDHTVFVPIMLCLGWLFQAALKRGMRYRLKVRQTSLPARGRPLILYLRPFQFDGVALGKGMPAFGAISWSPYSIEQVVCMSLESSGEVVTVGRPREGVPELGARRIYFNHDLWQAGVRELMQAASLVIINVGAPGAIFTELSAAFSLLSPHQLWLFQPFCLFAKDDRRLDGAAEVIKELECLWSRTGVPDHVLEAPIIQFADGWRPQPIYSVKQGADLNGSVLVTSATRVALQRMPKNWKRGLSEDEWAELLKPRA